MDPTSLNSVDQGSSQTVVQNPGQEDNQSVVRNFVNPVNSGNSGQVRYQSNKHKKKVNDNQIPGDIKNSTELQKQLVCYLAFRFKNKPRDWKCVIRDWEIRDLNPENAADREYLRHLVYNYTKPGSRHGPPGHLCQFYKKCMDDALAITHPVKHIFKDITMYVSNEEKDTNQSTPTNADRKRKTSSLDDNQSCMTNELSLVTNESSDLPGPAPKKADNCTQKSLKTDESTDNSNQIDADDFTEEVFCVSNEKRIEVKNTYTFVKNNIFEMTEDPPDTGFSVLRMGPRKKSYKNWIRCFTESS
uniref:ARID domain-containing protein n=1 Tax=Strongyloides stercoralis TaxID=6248 RepID=A0A0K0DS46_STRER